MIVIEYMENGSLDGFLRVSITFIEHEAQSSSIFYNFYLHWLESVPDSRQSAAGSVHHINIINLVLELLQCCDLHFPHGQWRWLTCLCFSMLCRNMMVSSQSSSWWGCCGASQQEWDISLIWDTSIEIWLHETSLSTAILYEKCRTSACQGW